MSKLTLSVDGDVIRNAKRFAKRQGLSVSQIVQGYLSSVAAPSTAIARDTPILRSLRGSLKKADIADYHKHLTAKYR